jgi:hypothetical protein
MKRFSVLSALLWAGLAASQAWATPVCPNGGTLTTFLATGYSCQIGSDIFSGFTYISSAQGGAVAVTSDGVTVDTLGPSGSGAGVLNSDIGLEFNAAWSVTAGQTTDADIGFIVTVLNGSAMLITDTGVAQTSGVSPNGSASVAEDSCGPAPCTPGTNAVLTFDDGTGDSQRVNSTTFSPVGSLEVSKDISATGGTDGFASITLVSDTFSQSPVPEPASALLSGLPLIGLCGLALRRRAKKA